MTRIVVVSFLNEDVSEGLNELLHNYEDPFVTFSYDFNNTIFNMSVIDSCVSHGVPYHAFVEETDDVPPVDDLGSFTHVINSQKELLKTITTGDVLAIAWDESPEVHAVIESVEDFALDTWGIRNGLQMIELDFDLEDDEMEEFLMESFRSFSMVFAEYLVRQIVPRIKEEIMEDLLDHLELDTE